ncbi:MAG: hypothetical protein ACOCXT_00520 [Candidatus Dojkabacteria bacterium]
MSGSIKEQFKSMSPRKISISLIAITMIFVLGAVVFAWRMSSSSSDVGPGPSNAYDDSPFIITISPSAVAQVDDTDDDLSLTPTEMDEDDVEVTETETDDDLTTSPTDDDNDLSASPTTTSSIFDDDSPTGSTDIHTPTGTTSMTLTESPTSSYDENDYGYSGSESTTPTTALPTAGILGENTLWFIIMSLGMVVTSSLIIGLRTKSRFGDDPVGKAIRTLKKDK